MLQPFPTNWGFLASVDRAGGGGKALGITIKIPAKTVVLFIGNLRWDSVGYTGLRSAGKQERMSNHSNKLELKSLRLHVCT